MGNRIQPSSNRVTSKRRLTIELLVANRLLLFLFMLPVMVQAQFTFATNNGAITITRYSGPGGAVSVPDTINFLPVTRIGNYAFSGRANLTSITLASGVTSIGYESFKFCYNLTSVTIGTNLTSIGGRAFEGCAALLNVPMSPNLTDIGDSAFYNCTSLTNVALGSSVLNIWNAAFQACTNLRSVTISASVTNIGDWVFDDCRRLTEVTLGGSFPKIGSGAFSSCWSLTNLTIPNSVTNIGDWAFHYCTNLTGIYFLGNAPSAASSSFSGDYQTTVYYLPGRTGWRPTLGGRPTALWTPPPPIVSCPAQLFLDCTNGAAIGTVQASVRDANGFPLIVVWAVNGTPYETNQIPSGASRTASNLPFMANFQLGDHVVEVSTSNEYANPTTCSTHVLVRDTIPPTIQCPLHVVVSPNNDCAASNVNLGLPLIFDNCGIASVTNNAPRIFLLGTNLVTWRVVDGNGNSNSCVQQVIVRDTTPPQIQGIAANPNALWPPNHRLVQVNLIVHAVDDCDPRPLAQITRVMSNQPNDSFAPDWEITGPLSLNLRAERSGTAGGRTYTILVRCEDASGNVSTASVDVTVPQHWNGRR